MLGRHRLFTCLLTFVLCLAALAQFAARVDRTPLMVDEAESSINAFSILERGYPGDTHLGIPIFENMLLRPWPEHPEYEFKDVSYSDRGFAVYHSWLPLYAIAGSFRLLGVQAPQPRPDWHVDIDLSRFKWRTFAARAPSFVAGAILLAVLFVAARRLGGIEAALAILVLAGQSSSVLSAVVFARYYALALLLSAVGWLTLQLALAGGSWRRDVGHALVLVLLFYTQLLVFLTFVILTGLGLLVRGRDRRSALRFAVMLCIVAVAVVPWIVSTGFVRQMQYVPPGWPLLRFPEDVAMYLAARIPYLAVLAAGFAWLGWLIVGSAGEDRRRLYERWRRDGWQFVLLVTWMLLSVFLWCFATPAASMFPQRLSVSLFIPGLLLVAAVLGNASRFVVWSEIVAVALAGVFLASAGVLRSPPAAAQQFENLGRTFELLNGLNLKADAKVYAAPGTQLIFSFYSDKPIQSLAPVRKQFLDTYPGEVAYLEPQFDWEFTAPSSRDLQIRALRLGQPLDDESGRHWERQLASRLACERTMPRVSMVMPRLETLPPFAEAAMGDVRTRAEQLAQAEQARWGSIPFARGFNVRSAADLWEVFFYRLVDPDSRRGPHQNAAARLRAGLAECLPIANEVIFYSPHSLSTAQIAPEYPVGDFVQVTTDKSCPTDHRQVGTIEPDRRHASGVSRLDVGLGVANEE
jgi:hypothetical protein